MSPTTTTITLGDAISAVEQADNSYQKAVTQTGNDQQLADAAQQKADAAKSVVAEDQATQKTAAQGRNAALRGAIAAFNAALIPGVDDPAPVPDPAPPAPTDVPA